VKQTMEMPWWLIIRCKSEEKATLAECLGIPLETPGPELGSLNSRGLRPTVTLWELEGLPWNNHHVYPLVILHSYGKSPFWMGKSTISMAIFNSYVKLPEGSSYNMVRSINRRFSIDEIISPKMVHYLLTCVFFSPCPDDQLDFLWIMEIQRSKGLPMGVTDVRFVERNRWLDDFPRDEEQLLVIRLTHGWNHSFFAAYHLVMTFTVSEPWKDPPCY
jgi:hypothetical protein